MTSRRGCRSRLLSAGFILLFFHQVRREFGERAALYGYGNSRHVGRLACLFARRRDRYPAGHDVFSGAAFYLPWVRSGGRRGLLVAGILLGLAVLAKGPLPLVLIAPLLWIAGRRWPDLFILAGATIAVALPWYVFAISETETSSSTNSSGSTISPVSPARFAARSAMVVLHSGSDRPYCFLGRRCWRSLRTSTKDNRRKLLLFVIAFGLVFFSAATNKLPGLSAASAAISGGNRGCETNGGPQDNVRLWWFPRRF